MEFRIKQARERKNLTQEMLASMLGISFTTLSGYETGKHDPKSDTLVAIARICEVSTDYLLGLVDDPVPTWAKKVDAQTAKALEFANTYTKLDEHGKKMVKFALDEESSRMSEQEKPVRVLSLQVYDEPSAAGLPLDAGSHFERIDFAADEVPADIDFGVRIMGKSMEPAIPDGCIAFVKRSELANNNDIVIARVADGMVCKRAICSGNRLLYLKSENPAYPNIMGADLNGATISGIVRGWKFMP